MIKNTNNNHAFPLLRNSTFPFQITYTHYVFISAIFSNLTHPRFPIHPVIYITFHLRIIPNCFICTPSERWFRIEGRSDRLFRRFEKEKGILKDVRDKEVRNLFFVRPQPVPKKKNQNIPKSTIYTIIPFFLDYLGLGLGLRSKL